MEIKETLILDENEPLSKAVSDVLDTGTAVIVTKNKKYTGLIDDKNLKNFSVQDPSKTKCKSVIVKPPVLAPETGILERINAFLTGHFKSLPVVNENGTPLGITTRVELLKDMKDASLIPKVAVKTMMNSPVYVIDEKKTVGEAKNAMKKFGARRLVVTRRGSLVGTFSTFDLTRGTKKPKGRQRMATVISSKTNFDDFVLAELYRPDVTSIKVDSTVEDAAKRMITKEVSSIVILEKDKKPMGVISALDIFRTIKELAEEKVRVEISGLTKDTLMYRDMIRDEVQKVADKFQKSYGISEVKVHVKKGKSVYTINILVDADKETITVRTEGPSVKDTINMAVAEMRIRLAREKRMKTSRKVLKKGGLQ